ncbi:MAG: cellulase N-terminal Ig-like domain-containing protein, partial [Acidobacteriota bacterium]
MKRSIFLLIFFNAATVLAAAQTVFIRFNQAGYLPSDTKSAIAFSQTPIADETFIVRNASGVIYRGKVKLIQPS